MRSRLLTAGLVAALTALGMSAAAQAPAPAPGGVPPGVPPAGGSNAIFIPPPSADAPPPSSDPRNFEGLYSGAAGGFGGGGGGRGGPGGGPGGGPPTGNPPGGAPGGAPGFGGGGPPGGAPGGAPGFGGGPRGGGVDYTAAAQERVNKRRALQQQSKEEPPPSFYCRPYANIAAVAEPIFPTKVVQTRNRLVFFPEEGGGYWEIHIDGVHPQGKALVPTYNGDSIGHWEGDTLVVDVIGFNGKSWIDNAAGPNSTKTHVTARIQKIEGGRKLEVKSQIEDPDTYLKPITRTATLQWNPELQLGEFACEESIGIGAYPAQRAAGFSEN